jgi:hypothetical protein
MIEGGSDTDEQDTEFTSVLHETIMWRTLGTTFDTAGSIPPAPSTLLQLLLGMFPCNTLLFLRSPKHYITLHPPQQLFVVEWDSLLDVDLLKQRSAVRASASYLTK